MTPIQWTAGARRRLGRRGGGRASEEAVVGRAPPAAGPAETLTTQKTKNEAGLFVFFARAGPLIPT